MNPFRIGRLAVVAVALVIAVLAAFAPAVQNEFVNFDDDTYVFKNLQVQRGIDPESLRWAFTNLDSRNWHPLTWISHMIDFQLFGLWAGGHHAVSVLIHAANAALLFGVLHALTGSFWRSALVAALFGLHPLRVESVAWASERKDVLTVLFGFAALGAYLRYVRRRTAGAYAAALGLFACALMSKAMLVSFPALLLLLDLWPLNRWSRATAVGFLPGRRLLLEKVPFLALSAAVSITSYVAQDAGGSVGYFFPLNERVANAFTSYVAYLAKTLWPTNLAVFYPFYAADVTLWKSVAAVAFVAAATILVTFHLPRRPAWFVGWLWYLGTLVPVIGFIQVGSQSMADRYTYFPQIGVLLLIVWGLGDLTASRPKTRWAILAVTPIVLAALAATTWATVTLWRTNETLFFHAAQVTENNYIAFSNLGRSLIDQGRLAEGSEYLSRSVRVAPAFRARLFEASGDHYAGLGRKREAADNYRKALALEPKRNIQKKLRDLGDLANLPPTAPVPDPHGGRVNPHPGRVIASDFDRGNILVKEGRREEAEAAYREAIRTAPGDYESWHNLGCVLGELGRLDEAAAAFEETLRLKPDHPTARKNLQLIPGHLPRAAR